MADNLPAPESRVESYLAKAAGEDVTIPEEPLSRLEQYLAAIAEGGGGGGGGTTYTAGNNIQISADNVISATDTTYTAGNGIIINNDAISVDLAQTTGTSTTKVMSQDATTDAINGIVLTGSGAPTTSTTGTVGQLYEDTTNGKLYQCTDATNPYVWSEVGAGGGGSAVTILTRDDYDHPANNPTSLALWNLDTGFYMIDPNISGIYKVSFGQYDTRNMLKGDSFIIVKNKHPDANWSNFYKDNLWINYWNSGIGINTGNYFDTDSNFLTRKSVKNDLTSTNTDLPLSAKQGKELNDKVTPTSGSGAPTTSTVGILGKIYIDTATDTAYMCTKVDSTIPEYTWKQITS